MPAPWPPRVRHGKHSFLTRANSVRVFTRSPPEQRASSASDGRNGHRRSENSSGGHVVRRECRARLHRVACVRPIVASGAYPYARCAGSRSVSQPCLRQSGRRDGSRSRRGSAHGLRHLGYRATGNNCALNSLHANLTFTRTALAVLCGWLLGTHLLGRESPARAPRQGADAHDP